MRQNLEDDPQAALEGKAAASRQAAEAAAALGYWPMDLAEMVRKVEAERQAAEAAAALKAEEERLLEIARKVEADRQAAEAERQAAEAQRKAAVAERRQLLLAGLKAEEDRKAALAGRAAQKAEKDVDLIFFSPRAERQAVEVAAARKAKLDISQVSAAEVKITTARSTCTISVTSAEEHMDAVTDILDSGVNGFLETVGREEELQAREEAKKASQEEVTPSESQETMQELKTAETLPREFVSHEDEALKADEDAHPTEELPTEKLETAQAVSAVSSEEMWALRKELEEMQALRKELETITTAIKAAAQVVSAEEVSNAKNEPALAEEVQTLKKEIEAVKAATAEEVQALKKEIEASRLGSCSANVLAPMAAESVEEQLQSASKALRECA